MPDTTITTLVTVPTAAVSTNDSSSGGSDKNAKLIGGLVGSIGGTILIGSLVVFFLFMKKRRSKLTNQLPDFADDTSRESNEKFGGFRKLFGSKAAAGAGAGGVAGYDDLERQVNQKLAIPAAGYAQDTDDDFEYRGVSNNNNLDSVFRSSGNNTGQNSSGTSTKQHSRFNSVYNPMAPMAESGPHDFQEEDAFFDNKEMTLVPLALHNFSSETDRDRLSEYELEDELFFHREPHQFWQNGGEELSNNSRLRFTEEI